MLNVQDECDLPEDDGYDLFTRETEKRDRDALRLRATPDWRLSRIDQLGRDPYGAK